MEGWVRLAKACIVPSLLIGLIGCTAEPSQIGIGPAELAATILLLFIPSAWFPIRLFGWEL